MPLKGNKSKQRLNGLAWLFVLTIEGGTHCFLVFFGKLII
jgi:hypothetical protein